MKKNWILLLLLCLPLMQGLEAQQIPGGIPQESPPTKFPDPLLEGTENFNLAIDIYGDSRGNFGPCG